MDIFKNPIEYLKELIHELVTDYANMAFDWIALFMLKPTDFEKYQYVNTVYKVMLGLSFTAALCFFVFALTTIKLKQIGGYNQRSSGEVIIKTFIGAFFAVTAPYLMTEVMLKVNNAVVNIWLSKGLNVDTFTKFVTFLPTASISIMLMSSVITILFVILTFQYIRRLGELMMLVAFSPLAGFSFINEEFNIWPIWWREVVCTVFQQAFQVTVLWMIFNLLGDAEKLEDYMLAAGFTMGVVIGPKYLRKFLYSTGTGRTMVGAAGGASKMAIYKLAAAKLTAR